MGITLNGLQLDDTSWRCEFHSIVQHISQRLGQTLHISMQQYRSIRHDESQIIDSLLKRFDVPKCFIEFGFGGWEFNCAELAYEWEGLLLDGDAYNIMIAKILFRKRVEAKQLWITLDTLETVHRYAAHRYVGILSIDVDGNDYWFLENLIKIRPAVIIVEYNSTLGLRPITIPYQPSFYYRDYETIYYYGASLAAFAYLAKRNGYSLIQVQDAGINAFFVRDDLLGPEDRALDPRSAYRGQAYPDGSQPEQRWELIKHMPFIDVSTGSSQMSPDVAAASENASD